MNTAELISFADGLSLAGDPDATTPFVSPSTIATQSAALKATHNSRQTNQSKELTNLEHQQIDALIESLIEVASYVEGLANQKAQGDIAIFNQIVTRIGFQPKKAADKHQRSFEVIKTDKGMVHLRIKAMARREAVMWQYSPDVSNVANWSFPIITLGSEVIITGLKSAVNYAFRYAVILPPDSGKPTITAGKEEPKWSDAIFQVIP
jgi:hypothetical protein